MSTVFAHFICRIWATVLPMFAGSINGRSLCDSKWIGVVFLPHPLQLMLNLSIKRNTCACGTFAPRQCGIQVPHLRTCCACVADMQHLDHVADMQHPLQLMLKLSIKRNTCTIVLHLSQGPLGDPHPAPPCLSVPRSTARSPEKVGPAGRCCKKATVARRPAGKIGRRCCKNTTAYERTGEAEQNGGGIAGQIFFISPLMPA